MEDKIQDLIQIYEKFKRIREIKEVRYYIDSETKEIYFKELGGRRVGFH